MPMADIATVFEFVQWEGTAKFGGPPQMQRSFRNLASEGGGR